LIHEVLMPSRIIYGAGSLQRVGGLAKLWGTKALIVSDPVMLNNGLVERCSLYIAEMGMPYVSYCGVHTEPTTKHVEECLDICRAEGCDVVIAIGGGSCIDAAKAVAVLMTNEGSLDQYTPLGGQQFQSESLPLIAIPTTAGTGSEVTKVTVIIDTKSQVKMMISQPQLLPKAAIVDAELIKSCPPSVIASSGVDALCHAIEAYLSKKAQPITDVWALQAIQLMSKHLPIVYSQQASDHHYEQIALGAMLAGAAFSNASVTLIHGMSRPIGALFHIPHGISNAMLLPAVLEHMASRVSAERLANISEMMTVEHKEGTAFAGIRSEGQTDHKKTIALKEQAASVLLAVKSLCCTLGIGNLSQYGIERQVYMNAISKMASDAIDSGSPANCPFIVTKQEIEQLYQACFDYRYD